jgi:capsular exopolysaccharide synthesis family protein
VVAVTSALPSEGKTTTSVCLARASAHAGARVAIVDCDLRRRKVTSLLGAGAEGKGLLEVLAGEATLDEVLTLDKPSGAYLVPLSRGASTAFDLFATPEMEQLLDDLAERFELVVLDTAPALAVAETRVLAARADAVIVLARWRRTPYKAVDAALKVLENAGAKVAGVALTQVDMRKQSRYGYGDPGFYYAEYKSYYAQ